MRLPALTPLVLLLLLLSPLQFQLGAPASFRPPPAPPLMASYASILCAARRHA